MRGGDREFAAVPGREILCRLLQVFCFLKDALRNFEDGLARRRHRGEALAIADKDLDAEFVLEKFDLSAYSRLRSMQFFGGCRQVEPAPGNLKEVL